MHRVSKTAGISSIGLVRGVTLIELLVTLLIIAIIAGISYGTIVDTGSRTPRQVMQDIAQLFALASDEAAITGTIKGLFVESSKRLELRDLTRPGASEGSAVEALGDLVSGFASIGLVASKNQETEQGYSLLEDRGDFPEIEEPNWSKIIYSLILPSGYSIDSSVVTGSAGKTSYRGEQDESADDAPLVRFFPDGTVQPEGRFFLENAQQQITWDSSGHVAIID